MANYDVTIIANGSGPDILIWNGNGGTSSGAPFGLDAGDTVRFKKSGLFSGSIIVSGFNTNVWTSSSNLTLTTSFQTKTVASGTPGTLSTLTATAGSKTQTRFYEISGVDPDLTIDDIDDISRPNGSTDHSITIANGSSVTTYEVRLTSSTGTVIASRTGNGTLTVSNIPNAGSSRDYFVTGKVTTANGGTNTSSFILNYSVIHEDVGATVGDGGTSNFGIQVFDAAGNTVLDVSDRVIVFSDFVTGSLTSSELTKNITLAKAGTAVIDMTPVTVPVSNNAAQRHKILHTSVSGTTLTISRTSTSSGSGSAQSASFNYLVVFDPRAG